MIFIERNSQAVIPIPARDVVFDPSLAVIVSLESKSSANVYVVSGALDQSRQDFSVVTFEEGINDPSNGVIALPYDGEYTLRVYQNATFTSDLSALTTLHEEKAKCVS